MSRLSDVILLDGCCLGNIPAEPFGERARVIGVNLGVNPSLTICALTERAMSFIPDAAAGGVR